MVKSELRKSGLEIEKILGIETRVLYCCNEDAKLLSRNGIIILTDNRRLKNEEVWRIKLIYTYSNSSIPTVPCKLTILLSN